MELSIYIIYDFLRCAYRYEILILYPTSFLDFFSFKNWILFLGFSTNRLCILVLFFIGLCKQKLWFLVAKLLYKRKCPTVCPSVCLSVHQVYGQTRFSWPLIVISLQFFFVQIPLINEHLFCKYFVRLSVGNATKGFATYVCFHPCFYEILLFFCFCAI